MTPSSLQSAIDRYADTLSGLADPAARSQFLISLGRGLPEPRSEQLTEERRLTGCQSRVWLWPAQRSSDAAMTFEGTSDSVLMCGILSIFFGIVDGARAAEIKLMDDDVIKRLGLDTFVAPGRGNGLRLIVERLRSDASLLASGVAYG